MRETLLLLLLTGAVQAAIQNVSAVEFTATQAILKYQAPDSSACTVEVSENANFQPLVNDVDPVKFALASTDLREGNVEAGGERSFVIGKRAAEVALDGGRYSRALQANTRHYFRITCPGPGNVATGSFKTMNIQFGNNYLEAEPGDRKRPGEMAQPHIGLSNRTEQVIDPLTGLLLKRLSSGNDTTIPINGMPWQTARSSAWQGLSNIFAQDGQSASISASTAPLFLALKTGVGGAAYTGGMTSYAAPYAGILMMGYGYYQAHLVASINSGGTAPIDPEDAKIVACRTVDGVNCMATSDTYEATLHPAAADIAFGTKNPGDLWQKTGNGAPNWTQEGTRAGTVTCDGSPTVNRTGGEFFGPHWVTGSTININGTDYSVSNVVHSSRLTLTSNCPNSSGAGVPYLATNFGILVRKKTASSDRVSIDYGYVNYELDFFNNFTVGTSNLCSLQTVAGPTGNQGFNCFVPNGNLYWVDAESGEAHIWGNFNNVSPGGICGFDTGHVFDLVDPDKFYCGNTGPLYALKYYGNHSEPASGLFLYAGLPMCNTASPNASPYTNQQPCMVTTLVTPGTNLAALAAAFTTNPAYAPAFDPAKFPSPSGLEVEPGGSIVINYTQSGQFTLGWVIVYNPNATSNSEGGTMTGAAGNHGCLGGGAPGCMIAAMPSWARPGCRWCVIKHGVAAIAGWESTEVYGWNGKVGGGPYQVQVIDGSANGTGNVIDAGASLVNCPTNPYGATGLSCTKLTISSEPFGPADSLHTGLPGEMGDARVGDYFSIQVQLPINYLEQMRLIAKDPGTVPGTWVYTLQRDINHPTQHYYAPPTGPNPILYTLCNSMQNPGRIYAGATWMWNWGGDPHGMNTDGTTIPSDNTNFNGHQFWSNGAWAAVEIPAVDPRCAGMQCYATRVPAARPFLSVVTQTAPTAMIKSAPRFAGGTGLDESNLQSHVTGGGEVASPDRFAFMFDGRPYRGGYSSGSPDGVSGSHPATLIGGQLYKFGAADLTGIDLPFRKVYPTAAFSGRFPLTDVSGPSLGDVLGTGTQDSFKYCVPAVAGECRASSVPGEIYVNAPRVTYPYCFIAAQNMNLSDEQDICISGSPANRDGIAQIGMNESDLTGSSQRVLTKFVAARVLSPFWTPYVLPNGKWMIFESQFSGDGTANKALMLGKIPPPDEQDRSDRTTFVPITLRIPARRGSTAYVRFGYAENGDPGTFYCTSRNENCATVKPGDQAVDVVNPFYFEQTEAQSYQAVDCNNGCSIMIPGIPQRVVYYQVVFNQSGNVTQTPVQTTVVP